MTKRQRRLLIGLIPVAAILAFALKTLWDAGEFKLLSPKAPGSCEIVEGVESSEDISIDPVSGIAYISAADRRGGGGGHLYAYDLNAEPPTLSRLATDPDLELKPHGISLYRSPEGKLSLFAVNHRSDGEFVEIFDVTGDGLLHRESISDPLLTNPNDVAATGPRSFYATNDHRAVDRWGKLAEEYFQLPRSFAIHFDGSGSRIVAAGLAYANGIQLSPDGAKVYIAATLGRTVSVYRRNPEGDSLALEYVIDTGTGVDNIETDRDGNLWIGAQPRLITFTRYAANPGRLSPAQVIKVTFYPVDKFEVEEVYVNDGSEISGSSSAAVYGDRLLIGSVFDAKFLVCRLR